MPEPIRFRVRFRLSESAEAGEGNAVRCWRVSDIGLACRLPKRTASPTRPREKDPEVRLKADFGVFLTNER
ncbi:hypothetical protein CDO73_04485 [Saccharibacillus sp. O23]|nr:hypothetical protein CDO73_04485 [Saccharibacillus sp. O23]